MNDECSIAPWNGAPERPRPWHEGQVVEEDRVTVQILEVLRPWELPGEQVFISLLHRLLLRTEDDGTEVWSLRQGTQGPEEILGLSNVGRQGMWVRKL